MINFDNFRPMGQLLGCLAAAIRGNLPSILWPRLAAARHSKSQKEAARDLLAVRPLTWWQAALPNTRKPNKPKYQKTKIPKYQNTTPKNQKPKNQKHQIPKNQNTKKPKHQNTKKPTNQNTKIPKYQKNSKNVCVPFQFQRFNYCINNSSLALENVKCRNHFHLYVS